ncbi:hypothetical protein, partial [Streptomyces sp. SID3343]|uniref:hypothetical protein n=1 Tax=Streptomyces sp. SID3343 TaxID=2690260 RepID=UPI0013C043DB
MALLVQVLWWVPTGVGRVGCGVLAGLAFAALLGARRRLPGTVFTVVLGGAVLVHAGVGTARVPMLAVAVVPALYALARHRTAGVSAVGAGAVT